MRRSLAGLALLALAARHGVAAEEFPTRQVVIVSPYQAGGTSDIIARTLAAKLGERWHPTPIIENRPGANGAIGITAVARAAPDGHTLLATASSGLTINPLLNGAIGYDVARDLAPVTRTAVVANVLVVAPALPARSVAELVALARAKPNSLSYASQGVGSNGHLNGELFRQLTGVEMTHVPYKGSAPAVTDLVGGHVDLMFDNLPTVLEQVRGGQLRALAVTTAERSPLLPDVPTMAEAGIAGFRTSAWFAILAPKGLPPATRAAIEAAVEGALRDPAVGEKLASQGVTVLADGAAALEGAIDDEVKLWRGVIAKAGLRTE